MMRRLDTDGDGQISWNEGLDFVREDSSRRASSFIEESSLLETESEESSLVEKESTALSSKEKAAMELEQLRVNGTMTLMKLLQEQEAKEEAKKQLREKRWRNMLERQKASLVEREKALKKQQKDLDRLDREERWQKAEAQKKSNFLEKKSCPEQEVHSFLATPNTAHAKCLKLQLGDCADTKQVQTPSLAQCNEGHKGWQTVCLKER